MSLHFRVVFTRYRVHFLFRSIRSESDFVLETLIKSCIRAHQSFLTKESTKKAEDQLEQSRAGASNEANKLDRLLTLISKMISFKEGALITPTLIANLQNLFTQVSHFSFGPKIKQITKNLKKSLIKSYEKQKTNK